MRSRDYIPTRAEYPPAALAIEKAAWILLALVFFFLAFFGSQPEGSLGHAPRDPRDVWGAVADPNPTQPREQTP